MDAPNSIHDLIETLMDLNKPLPARLLYQFSDLPSDGCKVLASAWGAIPLQRRRALLQDLLELAEQDNLLMFEEVGRIALEDTDEDCLVSAIDLLMEAEDPKLVPIFLRLLTAQDLPESVRAAAANALGFYVYLGELEELKAEVHHKIEDALLQAYAKDPSDLVKRRALESLGYSNREEVTPLIRYAAAHASEEWLESALFAMGRSANEQWETQVLDHLNHSNPDVRGQAIHAAGELMLGAARARLLKQLDRETDEYLRTELIWALSHIGGEGIEEKFEQLLAKTDDDEEASFLEEALEMLQFTNEASDFELMEVDFARERDLHDEDDEDSDFWDEDEDEEEDERGDFDDEEWLRYVDEDKEDNEGSLDESYNLDDFDEDEE